MERFQLYMDCLKSKQTNKHTLWLQGTAVLGFMWLGCGTCHIKLYGLEILVRPTWEAVHLIAEYKLTFTRKSALNYKGLPYHFTVERVTYLYKMVLLLMET